MADHIPTAIVVMGVSGSGKSTVAAALASRLNWVFHDGDSFHPPANVEKMSHGHPLNDADRKPWLQAIATAISDTRNSRAHVVIACSALKRAYRDILRDGQRDVAFAFLDGSQQLIASRMAARSDHFMPTSLLDSQFATLERPSLDEWSHAVSIDLPVEDIVSQIISDFKLSEHR